MSLSLVVTVAISRRVVLLDPSIFYTQLDDHAHASFAKASTDCEVNSSYLTSASRSTRSTPSRRLVQPSPSLSIIYILSRLILHTSYITFHLPLCLYGGSSAQECRSGMARSSRFKYAEKSWSSRSAKTGIMVGTGQRGNWIRQRSTDHMRCE